MVRRFHAGWFSLFLLCAGLATLATTLALYLPELPISLRILTALAGGIAVEALRRAFRRGPPSFALGSAAFGTPPRAWRDASYEFGSVTLGEHEGSKVFLPRALTLRHGLVLGPTGSGKSFGFFLPNMAQSIAGSLVCTDPKSELWKYTSHYHTDARRFAPTDPDASVAFNWVPLCTDPRMAERIARAIVESGQTGRTEQVWLDLEAGFLAALFAHTATLTAPTPVSAYHLITHQKPDALLQALDSSSSEIAREQANLLRQTTERIRGSVVPVVAARLQFLRDPAVARFTSAVSTPPNFARLRQAPCAIYWCQRESDVARLRPLSAAFFTVLIEQLMEETKESEQSRRNVPVTLLLDEFPCVGPIPDFATLIAVARGRGLAFWLGIQSLAQLESCYGKPAAQTILTNCQTKLILPGLDIDSAEWVSRSLGQETRYVPRRSWHFRLLSLLPDSRTTGEAEQGRPLLTGDEVRRLPEEAMLAIVSNVHPLVLRRRRFRPVVAALRPIAPLNAPLCEKMNREAKSLLEGPPDLPADF